jgi:ClpP class serine protease
MRTEVLASQLSHETFMVHPKILDSFVGYLNDGMPNMGTNIKLANNSVEYEKIKHVAIISVDGAMYKKDMSGMCMSVASYQKILELGKQAEEDVEVNKVLWRVTTPGGTVAGINPVEEMIASSKKETYVLYEDLGASGGIYVFSACDYRYATKSAEIGSIGVVSGFYLNKKKKIEYVVSKRAENKVFDPENKDHRKKYMEKMNKWEQDFYDVVTKNTGLTEQQIEEGFNKGDTIFAEDAVEVGYLHGIKTFDGLLSELLNSKETKVVDTAVPTVQKSNKPAKKIQGENMTDQEIMASEPYTKLVASHEEQVTALNGSMEKIQASLKDTEGKLVEAQNTIASLNAKQEIIPEVMAMAFDRGVDKKTLVAMAQAETLDKAKVALADSMGSDGAFGASEDDSTSEEHVEANKKVYDEKAKALGITFIGGSK